MCVIIFIMDAIITNVASITEALTTDCTITITTITTTNTVVIIVNTNVSLTKVLLDVDHINVGETHGQGHSTFLCECRRRLAEAWILGVKRLCAIQYYWTRALVATKLRQGKS